jgi:hypothetical protein
MTPEKCKELLDSGVLHAYAEGKTIQYKDSSGKWISVTNPSFAVAEYRVKPEPKYRPFTFTEITDLLGKIIVSNRDIEYIIHSITMYLDKSWNIKITKVNENYISLSISSKDLLKDYTLNEKPCGVLDETNM